MNNFIKIVINALKPNKHRPILRLISRTEHGISRNRIKSNIIKALTALHDQGYQSFLVGGSVRDMLLNRDYVDIDVATNATPSQIKRSFKRAYIVGKRFKIVHIVLGGVTIEVTTFRAAMPKRSSLWRRNNRHRQVSDSGLLLQDNVYGSIEEDVYRRDITINALYYDIKQHNIYDYVGGVSDLHAKTIRIIGDPVDRYQEDPVRMLRVLRFAAKLNFNIESNTAQPIRDLARLLDQVPPARLFHESNKLFCTGHALASFILLRQYGLLFKMYPMLSNILENNHNACSLIEASLSETDQRIVANLPISAAFVYAVFLWGLVDAKVRRYNVLNMIDFDLVDKIGDKIINIQQRTTKFPNFMVKKMKNIWWLQYKMEQEKINLSVDSKTVDSKTVDSETVDSETVDSKTALKSYPDFKAAYDFLKLRYQNGGDKLCGLVKEYS